MRICNLSSGSDGNITYIEAGQTKILVDCGLSCQEVEKRLGLLKVNPDEINAIIVSHEHSDHIKGIEVFARRYKTKVYAHEKCWPALSKKLQKVSLNQFVTFAEMPFNVGDIVVNCVELPHDAEYCCGFSFVENQKKVSIITDLGHTNLRILESMKDSKLLYLEANHDVNMLMDNVRYSATLKRRILGSNGHLSNEACADALCKIASEGMYVMLSHLSRENNTPQKAFEVVCKALAKKGLVNNQNIHVGVASIQPSAIFVIN